MSSISKRKGQILFAGLLLIVALGTFFLWRPTDPGPEVPRSSAKSDPKFSTKSESSPSPAKRIYVDSNQAKVEPTLAPLPQNIPSPEWQDSLKEVLLKQGGGELKDLKISPIESLVWVHEGKSLNVETAKISFKDPRGLEVSFKAMVDSQTGKVLQTWDQPVIDDFSGSEKSGIKLDPRYLGQ